MGYSEAPPSIKLSSLVECYWAIDGHVSAHDVLPDGCIDVVWIIGQPAIVVGTMTQAIVAPDCPGGVVGVRFNPGEAARLFPEAPRELTDASAPLLDLWPDGARFEDALLHAIDGASGPDLLRRAAGALDDALGEYAASRAGAVDLRVRAAADVLAGGGSVREAAERACLSERQLARRFEARVGIGPKTFGRVMRFRRAADAIVAGERATNAAAIAGYADQAHFTREAKKLAGKTPRDLQRSRAIDEEEDRLRVRLSATAASDECSAADRERERRVAV